MDTSWLIKTNKQLTIKTEQAISGLGLHTGEKVTLKIKPNYPNSGIVFVRVDQDPNKKIAANISNVLEPSRALRRTSIGIETIEIHTIEHFMSACYGLGIDNLIVELDGPEVPGLDGSTQDFVDMIKKAGLVEQEAPKRFFTVKEPVFVDAQGASIIALPYNGFRISYTLDYGEDFFEAQYFDIDLTPESFIQEIAPGRTFCLEKEESELRKIGLGKGADYTNTLVITEKGVKQNQLRFSDEFVRHKVLDLIGDLSLVGAPMNAHIIAIKSGHSINVKLVEKLYRLKEKLEAAALKVVQEVPSFDQDVWDCNEIKKVLPHRYPFLLVDKIIEIEPEKRAVGIKNVTVNEEFFNGHFPGKPVMPGVLIVEAMAQVGGVIMLACKEHRGKMAFFMGIDKVKFRKPVMPGDTLRIETEVMKIRSRTGQMKARAIVDGKVVAEAELMFALVE